MGTKGRKTEVGSSPGSDPSLLLEVPSQWDRIGASYLVSDAEEQSLLCTELCMSSCMLNSLVLPRRTSPRVSGF